MSPELINKIVELNKTKELLEEVLETHSSENGRLCICGNYNYNHENYNYISGRYPIISDENLNNKLTELVINFC